MAHSTQSIQQDQPMMALQWVGRVIAFVPSTILLFSFSREALSGYPPGGSVTGATMSMILFSIAFLASIISIWWDWACGVVLVAIGVISAAALLAGALPEADVLPSIIVTAVPFMLAGTLLLFAHKRTHQRVPA